MKKRIWSITAVIVLLLLAACGQKDKNSVISGEGQKMPTPTERPVGTPMADISQVPNVQPTVTPTVSPEQMAVPGITQTIVPTLSIEPTAVLVPSGELTSAPTASASPTVEPSVEPTVSMPPTPEPTITKLPVPTATLIPSVEPIETPTPTVTQSPVPTPTINPNPLITHGWQKMISVDEKYKIIFPEIYKESVVRKTNTELEISYSCMENTDISLTMGYTMLQKREYFVYEILSVGGTIIEECPSEKRTTCVWQLENKKYLATFIDEEYAGDLLGSAFGDAEWVPGVMHVVFSYPADKIDIYETEPYYFYIVNNEEE